MNNWELDFGKVLHFNEETLENEESELKITFNGTDFGYNIKSKESVDIGFGLELNVSILDINSGKIDICGEIYYFDKDQMNQIFSVHDYWKKNSEHGKSKNRIVDDNSVCPLGLVLHYNTDEHQYFLCDIEVQYNKFNQDEKMFLKTKEYSSDELIVLYTRTYFCDKFDCEFVKKRMNILNIRYATIYFFLTLIKSND